MSFCDMKPQTIDGADHVKAYRTLQSRVTAFLHNTILGISHSVWNKSCQQSHLKLQNILKLITVANIKSKVVPYSINPSSSTPVVPNCCHSKNPAPCWSNLPFLIFDIWALWRSTLSSRVPKCQKLKIVG